MLFAGLDIGGTKVEIAILQLKQSAGRVGYTVLSRQRQAIRRLEGYPSYLEQITSFIRTSLQEAGVEPQNLSGIGLSLPGSVDPDSMKILSSNTRILEGEDLRLDIIKGLNLGCPVVCYNDALCFCVAEAYALESFDFGHANFSPRYSSVAGIILGTGVGGGLVLAGQPLVGARGASCEWGHIPLVTNGLPCYCGGLGCAEAYLSGPAMEGIFNGRRYSQVPNPQSAAEIFALAEQMEPLALSVLADYRRKLAELVAFIVQICDPGVVVLGGGVSQQDSIYEGLSKEVAAKLFVKERGPAITKNMLGDSSGVLGAAFLAARSSSLEAFPKL